MTRDGQMLGKVGPVIAQRDSDVKCLFGSKDDGKRRVAKDEGVNGQ